MHNTRLLRYALYTKFMELTCNGAVVYFRVCVRSAARFSYQITNRTPMITTLRGGTTDC